MRSSFVWEALMLSALIMVGVGAITAWSITRQRARRPAPKTEQPAADAVMVKAVESVQLYASFAMNIDGPIFIDEATVEKTLIVKKDGDSQWNVSGAASGDSVDAANFRWIVRILESPGKLIVEQVKLNGDVVYTHEDDATPSSAASASTASSWR